MKNDFDKKKTGRTRGKSADPMPSNPEPSRHRTLAEGVQTRASRALAAEVPTRPRRGRAPRRDSRWMERSVRLMPKGLVGQTNARLVECAFFQYKEKQ